MDLNNIRLTKKEEDILSVLWASKDSLTVTEICRCANDMNMSLNQSTVQVTVNKLIKYGMIRVKDIKQTNTNFARTFEPVADSDQYVVLKMKQIMNSIDKNKRVHFIATLINDEELSEADLKELEALIHTLQKQR